MHVLDGDRPDLTPAQLISMVPVATGLAVALAGRRTSPEHERLLRGTLGWSVALVAADALLRAGRALAARPPALLPVTADVMAHPDTFVSELAGPEIEPGDELMVLDPVTDPYDEEDLEPVPVAGDGDTDGDGELDASLTETGRVDNEAGKPADFR